MKITLDLKKDEIEDIKNYFNFTNERSIQASIDVINGCDWIIGNPGYMNAIKLDDIIGKMLMQIDKNTKK